jgi:hypothetical protein
MKAILTSFFPGFVALTISIFNLTPARAETQYFQAHFRIESYTSTDSEINIRPYIKNLEQYTGLRLVAVEVVAGAIADSAAMIVFVKGKQEGPVFNLGQNTMVYKVFPSTGVFMGFGAEDIKLKIKDPAYIKSVNLVLTR